MMKKMIEEWKKELIEAGEIDPAEELSSSKIQLKYQDYKLKKMREAARGLEEDKPKKTKPEEKKEQPKKPDTPKKKKIIGGQQRTRFSQTVHELDELQKKVDTEIKQHSELLNVIYSSTSPALFEIINDTSITDSEKKMKEVRKITEKLQEESENGFPIPAGLEKEFADYLKYKETSTKELESIYSQIKEKSDHLITSLPEMEEA